MMSFRPCVRKSKIKMDSEVKRRKKWKVRVVFRTRILMRLYRGWAGCKLHYNDRMKALSPLTDHVVSLIVSGLVGVGLPESQVAVAPNNWSYLKSVGYVRAIVLINVNAKHRIPVSYP